MSSSRTATAPWRRIFTNLQEGQHSNQQPDQEQICSAVQELWDQQSSFVQSPAEAGEVLVFLLQHLSALEPSTDRQYQSRVTLCKLITAVLTSKAPGRLPANAGRIICTLLRHWADAHQIPVSQHTNSMQTLQQAALSALGALIPQCMSQLPAPEAAALLAVLNAATHTSHTSTGQQHASRASSSAAAQDLETPSLALAALLQCFPKGQAALLPQEAIPQVLAACSSTLHAWCLGRNQPIESPAHTRLFTVLTKLLATLIVEGKKSWLPHAAALVEGLRRLLTYGAPTSCAPASTAAAAAAPPLRAASGAGGGRSGPDVCQAGGTAEQDGSGGGSRGAYLPPHLRNQSRSRAQAPSPCASAAGDRWSDSDISDTESAAGSVGQADRPGPARVRMSVLLCLQSMCKSDSRAMQPHWTSLLPVQTPLQPRPLVPHLITVLLYDPLPKVRSLAAATIASLLEGPASKGYLQVADARAASSSSTRGTPARGFTTLSTSLGHLVISTHTGLMHALKQEGTVSVLPLVLRAVCILTSAMPADRLPAHLLPDTLNHVRTRCHALIQTPGFTTGLPASEQHAVLVAYMACLAEVCSSKKPIRSLALYLASIPTSPNPTQTATKHQIPGSATASTTEASLTAGANSSNSGDVDNGAVSQPVTSLTLASSASSPLTVGMDLTQELLQYCVHSQPTIRIEALAAVKGLAERYVDIIPGLWPSITHVVVHNLSTHLSTSDQAGSRKSSQSGAVHVSSRGTAGAGGAPRQSSAGQTPGSSSPEDKASQHAVKLLGAYITAVAKQHGFGPVPSQVCLDGDLSPDQWLPYLKHTNTLPGTRAHTSNPPSPASRLPGQAATTQPRSLPFPDGSAGPEGAESHMLVVLSTWWTDALDTALSGAASHAAAMVRTASLTAMSDVSPAVFHVLSGTHRQLVVEAAALATAHDPAPAVCAAGCKLLGSLASCSEVMQQDSMCSVLVTGLVKPLQHEVQSVRVAAAWALAAVCEAVACAAASWAQGWPPALAQHLPLLVDAAVQAAQGEGVEKVRASGMRALAALLYCMPGDDEHGQLQIRWLQSAVSSIQSGLATGNVRVQWAACLACQALFTNEVLTGQQLVRQLCSPLVLILTMLVRDCGNFKVRAQAAACLQAITHKDVFGAFTDVLTVTCAALDTLDADPSWGNVGAGSHTSGSASSEAGIAVMDQPDGEGGARSFPNFRHLPALVAQLQETVVHLLQFMSAADVARCKDALGKRVPVMCKAVEAVTGAALQSVLHSDPDATSPAGAAGWQDAAAGSTSSPAVQHLLSLCGSSKPSNVDPITLLPLDLLDSPANPATLEPGATDPAGGSGIEEKQLCVQLLLQAVQNSELHDDGALMERRSGIRACARTRTRSDHAAHRMQVCAQHSGLGSGHSPLSRRPMRPNRVMPARLPFRNPVLRFPDSQKSLHVPRSASGAAASIPATAFGGNDNNGSNGSNGGGGGGGGGGGNGGGKPEEGGGAMDPAIVALLSAAGRAVDSFPPDFAAALVAGKVTPEILKRFLELEANLLAKLVWGMQGFRERLLGDPSFPVKVAIECGIGVVTKVTAEKTKRGESFWSEIDFVGANVVMAIIADFMLTWIPAPTLSYVPRKASSNAILNFFASCPDNAFQKVPPGMEPFSAAQRVGAIMRNGGKLLGVGFCSSMLGVGITNALILARQLFDPTWAPPNKPQNVLATSAAYGVYMSVSSNLRYQIIAGVIEERGIETLFKGNHQLCHALSFIVRTANTFVGSLLWVDFVRLCGMQKATAPPPPPALKAA